MRRFAALFLLVLAFIAGFGLSAVEVQAQNVEGAAPEGIAASGGPDPFGYTWRDNVPTTGGCGYDFINIATTGTAIGTGDDTVYSGIPIGFTFTYYGGSQTTVNVATNGYIAFGTTGNSFSNTCPMPVTLNDLQISPFWDDLYVFAPSTMVYQTMGVAPNRKFIVQWNNVGFCCTSPPAGTGLTFQMQLWEGSNIIAYMYSDIEQSTRTQGNSATIGIDGPGAANFLQYICNQTTAPAPLLNGRAVYFLPPGVTACAVAATATPTPVPVVGGVDVADQILADAPAAVVPADDRTGRLVSLALVTFLAIAGALVLGLRRK